MLGGSDLYAAYSRDIPSIGQQQQHSQQNVPTSSSVDLGHDTDKRSAPQLAPMKHESLPIPVPSMESPLMTPDEKVYLLSAELKRQREQNQQQQQQQPSQPGYLDKLWGKKRDVLKLVMFMLVFMLALALHWVAKHYMREYLDANALTTGKEFLFRMLYPCAVLFILWNMRVFNK